MASAPAAPALVAQKLATVSDVTWDWARIKAFTVERIETIIARRGVPASCLTAPRLDIAIPAIEAMRYSPLKHEIAVLIATTMDTRFAHEAHPAFIEIIKQLTADEVGLLAGLPEAGQVVAMANVSYVDRAERVHAAIRHVIPGHLAEACPSRKAIPSYVDNMLRLSLIAAPSSLAIRDDRHYRDLLAQAFIADIEARLPAHLRPVVERRVITLTDFGETFRHCCLDERPH